MKLNFINQYCNMLSINRMCRLLNVSRSHYYAKASSSVTAEKETSIEQEVVSIFREHSRRYGSRRILEELRSRGWTIGRGKVISIMRMYNLHAIQPRRFIPRTTKSNPGQYRNPNLLLQLGLPQAPDQVWVGDITYIPLIGGTWGYLATWMDLFSRRLVGWALDDNMRDELVIKAFRRACNQRSPKAGLIIHSDGGKQYGSKAFRSLLSIGFKQSMTRKDNHYDNAFMESFYSRFKTELLEGGAFRSLEDAYKECFSFIEEYYNRKRRHSSLGYYTPEEFESQYYGQV